LEQGKLNLEQGKLKLELKQIDLALAGKTTFDELLDSELPRISDQTPKQPSTSKACLRRIPKKVSEWHDFQELVKQYRENLPPGLARTSIHKMSIDPSSNLLKAGSEAELSHALMATLGSSLNHVFDSSVMTCSFSLSPFRFGQALRTPDFVSYRNYSSDLHGSNSPCDPGFTADPQKFIMYYVGETKRRNFALTPDLSDIVRRYTNGDEHVMDAIYQLCGYQVKFNCKFGILSTYEFTWATLLTESGDLLISPAFCQDGAGPLSTTNMMRYVICRAADDVRSKIQWKLPQDLIPPADEVVKQEVKRLKLNARKEAKDVENKNLKANKEVQMDSPRGGGNDENECELRFLHVMVDHEDRITWQGRIEESDGVRSLVAIKCYADSRSRDLEVACYDALWPLQGQCIPTLLKRDLQLESDGERRHGLVLSWVGESDNGNYLTLPTRVLQRARELVASMHKLGVAHGDVRAENMNYDFRTDKLFIFDFSQAEMRRAPDDEEFDEACKKDLESLDMDIEWSMTAEGKAIQYIP
jgi:hypothetical protein